jgi:hypothetical protein
LLSCLPVLFRMSCSACPVCLSFLAFPVSPAQFVCPILSVCPALPVMFLPVLSWLYWHDSLILPVSFWLSCSACPVLLVLYCLSCSASPVLFCHSSFVLPVLSWPYIDAKARNYEHKKEREKSGSAKVQTQKCKI